MKYLRYYLTTFRMAVVLLAWLLPVGASQAQTETDGNEEVVVTDDADDDSESSQEDDELVFPESMGDYLDSLMTLYMAKTYLVSESDCQTAADDPVFTREEYMDRLYRMPTIIEMPWNEVVQACIDRYTKKSRRQVSYLLGACNFYMPFFEEALEAYQVPLELKYLPIIESALNPLATSRVGAGGLWQFMPATAKTYNMEISTLVDERRDIVKSSWAAARYLRDLSSMTGHWPLPPTIAVLRTSTRPFTVQEASETTGRYVLTCPARPVATCQPSLLPTT